MTELRDEITYGGPKNFSAEQLAEVSDLFGARGALYYTSTEAIPLEFVGEGKLDVELPLALPTFAQYQEVKGYRDPRLWVDLIQQATGKLRWKPYRVARVVIVNQSPRSVAPNRLTPKALVDALKIGTYGRPDGMRLHYFGAITDDDPESIRLEVYQGKGIEKDVTRSSCHVRVEPLPEDASPPFEAVFSSAPFDEGNSA